METECAVTITHAGRELLAVVEGSEGPAYVSRCIDLESGDDVRIPDHVEGKILSECRYDAWDGHIALVAYCDNCGAPELRDEAYFYAGSYAVPEGVFCRRCTR